MTKKRDLCGIDTFIEEMMVVWQVPGVALAVVRGDEVVLAKGYGKRDVEQALPVTTKTIFPIGSCSKAFTAMSLAQLVDDGMIAWDTPVREYLPWFRLHDSFASKRMTPRDLLSHRSGLPRHDAMWYGSPASREELVRRARYLPPTHDFRAVWQYQNLMFATAGLLVGEVTHSSWEEQVQKRILDPLGMNNSCFSVDAIQVANDYALPYIDKEGTIEKVPFRSLDAMGPAGSINSNIEDMTKWLSLLLNRGQHGEGRIVAEGSFQQMMLPQMVMGHPMTKEIPHHNYGLGWVVSPYRGHNMLWHTGGIDGFSALVTFMPEEKIAMVALTNLGVSKHMHALISYNIYERLLGLSLTDWNSRAVKQVAEEKNVVAKQVAQLKAEQVMNTLPTHPIEVYAGRYMHPGYGELAVKESEGRLVVALNGRELAFTHYHYDVFSCSLNNVILLASFRSSTKGKVESVSIPLEPTAKEPIVFIKEPR